MEMIDMGSKDTMTPTAIEGKSESKVRYPTLYLDNGKVPDELMGKETGAMCRLEIVGKVVSKSIDERDGKERKSMTIEIHKMGYVADAGKKSKDEYLDMDEKAREDYDKEQLTMGEKDASD